MGGRRVSISRGELLAQREALVRVIQDLVDWTDEETTAEALSGTVRLIDELLAPTRFTWKIKVDTEYHNGKGQGGNIWDEDFTGTAEGLEQHVKEVVAETLIGVDDDRFEGEGTPISTTISIEWKQP